MPRTTAGTLRLACAVLLCVLNCQFKLARSSCADPPNRDSLYTCDPADVDFLQNYYPDVWWQNTGASAYMSPIESLKANFRCCLYCVWSLEYPESVPITTGYPPILDCNSFATDFDSYDTNADQRLSPAEFSAYLSTPLNSALISRKFRGGVLSISRPCT